MPTPTPIPTAMFSGSISYGNVLVLNGLICIGMAAVVMLAVWLAYTFLIEKRRAA